MLRTEFLEERERAQDRLAVDTGIPHRRMTALVASRRVFTPDTAARLPRHSGNSPAFPVGVQKGYDRRKARKELGERIEREVRPLANA